MCIRDRGSTDFDGGSSGEGAAAKEIDVTAAYALGESGRTFSVASLWWGGQGARKLDLILPKHRQPSNQSP